MPPLSPDPRPCLVLPGEKVIDQETMERFAREMAKKDAEIDTLRSELRRQSQELERAREALKKIVEYKCECDGETEGECHVVIASKALTRPAPEKP